MSVVRRRGCHHLLDNALIVDSLYRVIARHADTFLQSRDRSPLSTAALPAPPCALRVASSCTAVTTATVPAAFVAPVAAAVAAAVIAAAWLAARRSRSNASSAS